MKTSRNAKHISPSQTHGYIGETKRKAKPPPKYEPGSIITDYVYKRDMCLLNDMFVCDETKELIQERIDKGYYNK